MNADTPGVVQKFSVMNTSMQGRKEENKIRTLQLKDQSMQNLDSRKKNLVGRKFGGKGNLECYRQVSQFLESRRFRSFQIVSSDVK